MSPDLTSYRSAVVKLISQADGLRKEAIGSGDPFALRCAEAAVRSADAAFLCLAMAEETRGAMDALTARVDALAR